MRQTLLAASVLALLSPAARASSEQGLQRIGRWFTYNGQYKYLVGFDTQELACDTTIDYNQALDKFVQYGINKTRIWIYPWFGGEAFLSPWQYSNGKHNLDRWNTAYWQRVKDFITAAKNRSIVVEVTIFSEYPAPSDYMWNNAKYRPAWNRAFNENSAFSTNSSNHFYPEFFDLSLDERSSSGKTLADYQRDLVDKVIAELGSFPNVYFEIHNEFPAVWNVADQHPIDRVYGWQQHWIDYISERTTRPVAAQSHDGSGANTYGIGYFQNRPALDVMNFRFTNTATPQILSDLFHSVQTKGKILSVNESGDFYGTLLDSRTSYMWGMFLSGGYFALYEDDSSRILTDSGWIAGAKRLQILRDIVEGLKYWEMSPVDASGNEYDSLVTEGPSGANKQLIANPGSEYLAYFWGSKTTTPVKITLPSSNYTYEWHDPRSGHLLSSGSVSGGGVAIISAPATTGWSEVAGVALVIRNASSTSTVHLSDLTWTSVINGWGPAEKDTSNGESLSGDGKTITLNGRTYTKGLGVHAYSEIVCNLNSRYAIFLSDIGVDDEIASAGSVAFQVWLDGTNVYDSGIMTASSATKTVNVSVSGKNTLKLIVTDGGDGKSDDHADWANARLTYIATGNPAPVITSAPSSTGTIGTGLSYQITASNGPTGFNAAGLPAGLSVSTATGLISGTPTTAATSSVALSASNAGGTGTKTLTLAVYSACDVNRDGSTNVADVQLQVNQALGAAACTSDLNRDGKCNVIDVQREVNASLGGQCLLGQ